MPRSVVHILILVLSILTATAAASGSVIHVPGDHDTIQSAIESSSNGDTVLVAPGTYIENINLMGRAIHLMAEDQTENATVIDGSNAPHPDSASTVLVVSGEGKETIIEGFTIIGGHGTISPIMYNEGEIFGGGIFIQFSSPTIRNNVIKQNSAFIAAGLLANISAARIEDNIIKNNFASRAAGGLVVSSMGGETDSVPVVRRNLIYNNRAIDHAGGVEIGHGGEAVFSHNIVAHNRAISAAGVFLLGVDDRTIFRNNVIVYNTSTRFTGSGIRVGVMGGIPLITSNIVAYNDTAGGIFVMEHHLSPLITHNVVWGNTSENFIGADPAVGDTSWGFNLNGVPCDSFYNIIRDPMIFGEHPWKFSLGYGSPCIDAGSPELPFDPDGTVTDAGAMYFSQLDSITVDTRPLVNEIEPGDVLFFELDIDNPGTGTFDGQIWTAVRLPGGATVSPLLGPKNMAFMPGESNSWTIPQKTSQSLPPGSTYVYTVKLGQFPDTTIASDSFTFTVLEVIAE